MIEIIIMSSRHELAAGGNFYLAASSHNELAEWWRPMRRSLLFLGPHPSTRLRMLVQARVLLQHQSAHPCSERVSHHELVEWWRPIRECLLFLGPHPSTRLRMLV
jgi:hypothetical protein